MRRFISILWLEYIICCSGQAQEIPLSLNIGDTVPALHVSDWLKGTPFQELERGKIYVIEFWATWCQPCIKIMPKLSALARKYNNHITFLGVNVFPKERYPNSAAKSLIDSMGRRIKYSIAFDDSGLMETTWMDASGEHAVPSAFVVNAEGRLAWIGHPLELDNVLPNLLNNTWNINTASESRKIKYRINKVDNNEREGYFRFYRNGSGSDWYGEPDSTLFYINKIVAREPDLKYADNIAFHTFVALLKTDMDKAYDYAMNAMQQTYPVGPPREAIIKGIINYSTHLDNIPAKIYLLGAEAMKGYIAYTPKNLMMMAEFYWRAGDKSNARQCLKKARKAMRKAKLYGKGHFF